MENNKQRIKMDYDTFLKNKVKLASNDGVDQININPSSALMEHQKAAVQWMCLGGQRACFASFGLGKSVIQLETVRIMREHAGGMGLIVCPLGVRQEFVRDSQEILKWEKKPVFIRRIEEATDPSGIYLTNYETIRDGKMDPASFSVASLDEASILRGFGGSKTFREFMRLFTGDGGPCNDDRADGKTVKYRFVATATPSPNDYIELLAYADFLGIMDISQAKTRFFKRDSTKADKLTIHAHKEEEFWLWVASWALFIQKPSDLGFDDTGYSMPTLDVVWHEVETDHSLAGFDKMGQRKLFKDAAIGVQDAAQEKRDSLKNRIEKLKQIRAEKPDDHIIIWHDLEDERRAIQSAIPSSVAVYGSQDLQLREDRILGFSNGEFKELSTKPVIAGSGCNFQRYCNWSVFLGVGYKFNDFIQAIHRVQRFGQTKPVRIDIIYSEAERGIRAQLERKWKQHNKMVDKMREIVNKFGLSQMAMAQTLHRKMGIERIEVSGDGWRAINNDCVVETRLMEDESVDLIVTSIPFSSQYEYSPNYADFGHCDGNDEFFEQMDYLVPQLLRITKPGRLACVHVKDRIIPGGMTGLGFQTVYPFHLDTINSFRKHGWGYMGMKTIVTDVVRENNQTYRLGWTEQCKDGSKMGVGMPEYLLIFRKPTSDPTNGYADVPVVKLKQNYSRGRWQTDAHGYARSSGNRLPDAETVAQMAHKDIFRAYKKHSLETVYNHEHHVKLCETIDAAGKLPVTFMLLQPQSWTDEVWTDVTRMQTLNGTQWSHGKEMHLCPMQFDVADRCIQQYSQPGETVFDPFGGLMTVPYRALKWGRKGVGVELSPSYFTDGIAHLNAMEYKLSTPTLFDILDIEDKAEDQSEIEELQEVAV
jgi:DNA modification methylase